MTTIENYYKGMVKDGIWMKPDAEQETIFALKAQIEAKQIKGGKLSRSGKDWKLIPPKAGESKKVVTVNGKKITYHWCPHHNRYTVHQPQDCHLQQAQPDSKTKSAGATMPIKNKKEKKRGLALRVMNAILEGSDESSFNQDSGNEQEHSDSK